MADYELYDPDTGEYFDPDTLDPNSYEEVAGPGPDYGSADTISDTARDNSDDDWYDAPLAALSNAFIGTGRAAGNLIRLGGDLTGGLYENPVSRRASDFGKWISDSGSEIQEDTKRGLGIDRGSRAETMADVGSSVVPALGLIAAAPATGGGSLSVLGTLAAENLGRRYGELRDEGASIPRSALGAGGSAALNTAIGALNVPRALAGTSLPRKILELEGLNWLTSPFQTVGEAGVDAFATGKQLTPDELSNAIRENRTMGAITSPFFAAAGSLGNRAAERLSTRKTAQAEQMMSDAMESMALPPGAAEGPFLPGAEAQRGLPAPEGVYRSDAEVAPGMAETQGEGFTMRPPGPRNMEAPLPDGNLVLDSEQPILEGAGAQSPEGLIDAAPRPNVLVDDTPAIELETSSARTPEEQAFYERTQTEVSRGIPRVELDPNRPAGLVDAQGNPVAPQFDSEGRLVRSTYTDKSGRVYANTSPSSIDLQTYGPKAAEARATFEARKNAAANGLPAPEGVIYGEDFTARSKPIDQTKQVAKETFPNIRTEAPKVEPATAPAADQNRLDIMQSTTIPDFPIQKVQLANLKIFPNVKSAATNPDGTIPGKELGPYQKLPGIPDIVVRNRLDGTQDIITGRHKLAAAKKSGYTELDARVINEADGWDDNASRMLDAYVNILDDQGDVHDYVTLFSESGITESDARSKGLLNRPKGLQAFTIATKGSPELVTLLKNGRISDSAATAIAEIGAGRPDLQQAGLKWALPDENTGRIDPLPPERIADNMQALKTMEREKVAEAAQGVMFGSDNPLMAEADRMGRAAASIRKEIADRLNSIRGASLRPEIAAKEGLPVNNPAKIEERANQLRHEQKIWKSWSKFPELVKQVRDRLMGSERGAINIGDIRDMFSKSAVDKIAKDADIPRGRINEKEWADSENFLGGRTGHLMGDNEIGRGIAKAYRNAVVFPKTLADKFPLFDRAYRAALTQEKNKYRVGQGISQMLGDYWNLDDKSRVNAFLIKQRQLSAQGRPVPETPEAMAKAGLNPDEIVAVRAVRNAMNTSFATAKRAAMERATEIPFEEQRLAYLQAVEEGFNKIKAENYVPFSRFGDYFVEVREPKQVQNPDGSVGVEDTTTYFSLHGSRKEQMMRAAELAKKGMKVDVGLMQKPAIEAYGILPPDIAARFAKFDPDGENVYRPGWSKHLEKAELTPGFDLNLERALADYVVGLSNWSARQIAAPEYKASMKAMVRNPELLRYTQKYIDYQNKSSPELQKVRQFLALYYLTNVKSAALNLTQTITTTAPELGKYVGYSRVPGTMARAYKGALEHFTDPKAFAAKNPELAAQLDKAVKNGTVAEQVYRELSGLARNKSNKFSISDKAMMLFDGAEKFNRVSTFLAGMEAAGRKGLTGDGAREFAENFVRDTQFDYSKANRPEMARGKKAALFTFRMFGGNWLRLIRNNMSPENAKTAGALLGTMVAMGGLSAMPFSKTLLSLLEANGEDPKRKARELINNKFLAETALYGLPASVLGLNLSGAIGMGDIAPEVSGGIDSAAAQLGLGAIGNLYNKGKKAWWIASELDRPGRAVEEMLPEGLRHIARAVRVGAEGLRTPQREPVGRGEVYKPSMGELIEYGAGFNPQNFSNLYELQHSLDLNREAASDNKNINFKIAQAKYLGDKAEEARLRAEIKLYNKGVPESRRVSINETSIKSFIDRMKGTAGDKSTPKKARDEAKDIRRLYGQ